MNFIVGFVHGLLIGMICRSLGLTAIQTAFVWACSLPLLFAILKGLGY